MRLFALLLIPCSLFVCNPERDAASEASPQATNDQPATDPPPDASKTPDATIDEKPASKSAPKPKPDEAAKLRKQLLALLNEGRALTKKGDHAGGIAKYQEALKIDASDISVLGELGWAAYLSGDLELAHRTTAQALKFVRDENKRGMLLYNLGRIEEDREQFGEALDSYRASLVARPGNKTVQARLDALEAKLDAMAVAGSAGGELQGPDSFALEVLARDLTDLAAACKVIEEQRCDDYTLYEDEPCRCGPTLLATPGVDDSWGLLVLGDEGLWQAAWFPAVKTDKGWTVFSEVLYTYNPGAFGVFEEAELRPSTVDPLLAKGTQLVMRFFKSRVDRDLGLNEIEFETHDALVVCARNETGAHCTVPLITSYKFRREVEFPGEDLEIAGEEREHEDLPIDVGFTASTNFVDGKLVVEWTNVTGGFEPKDEGDIWSTTGRALAAGEYSLATLLGLPD